MTNRILGLSVIATLSLAGGCAERSTLLPYSDAALDRPATMLAVDAAKRHPYPETLPRPDKQLPVRAEINYWTDVIQIVNSSGQDWADVEFWVNGTYVVGIPALKNMEVKQISFKHFYDAQGQYIPLNGVQIEKLEMKLAGELFTVQSAPAR
jgi:hypothetical protein